MKTNPTPWPLTVPVLTGRDIYRGDYDSRDGKRHCLFGWLDITFTDRKSKRDAKVQIQKIARCERLAVFNDDPRNSTSKVAAVWNRAMQTLGYTERV